MFFIFTWQFVDVIVLHYIHLFSGCALMVQSQLKQKEVQVQALEQQATKLRDVDPEKEQMLSSRKVEVEERFSRLLAPLVERRKKLDQFKRVQQVCCVIVLKFVRHVRLGY